MEFDDVDSSGNDQRESNFTSSVSNEFCDDSATTLRSCGNAYMSYISSRVIMAAKHGDVEYLRHLIRIGPPADVSDGRGWSPMHHASAHATDVQCLEELLKYNSTNVDCRTRDNETALLIACKSKCGEVAEKAVDLLLHYGADPNLANKGVTPLMYAIWNGQLGVVVRLLCFAAKLDLHDSFGNAPLHVAAETGHLEIIKCLLKENAALCTWNHFGEMPLHVVARHGHIECLKELLQTVTERGHKEIIDLTNMIPVTALAVAASVGHTECVQILLDHGANPNIYPDASIPMVIYGNHMECLKLLLNAMDLPWLYRQDSPFEDFVQPILLAMVNDCIEYLKVFLCYGYPVSSVLQELWYLDVEENQDELLQSLELLLQFTAITGAVQEAFNLLSLNCKQNNANYDTVRWNNLLEKLKTPSTLVNLCRLKVRESMIPRYGYSFFKSALDSLHFPQELKKFLLYSE